MVETFGVASRKTANQTVADPSRTYALEPQATSFKPQASSNKLDKSWRVGYYRIRKRGHMNSKEINETIDRLDDAEWQRMKEHMDKKFPNMKLPTIKDFKELVRLYGLATEHHEKKLN